MAALLAALRSEHGWEFRAFFRHLPDALLTELMALYTVEGKKFKSRADVYIYLRDDAKTGAKLRDVETNWTRRSQGKVDKEWIEVKKVHETLNLGLPASAAAGDAALSAEALCHRIEKRLVKAEEELSTAYERDPCVFVMKQRTQAVLKARREASGAGGSGSALELDCEVTFLNARVDFPDGFPAVDKAGAGKWASGWVSVCIEAHDRAILEPFALELQRKVQTFTATSPAGSSFEAHYLSYPEWIELLVTRATATTTASLA